MSCRVNTASCTLPGTVAALLRKAQADPKGIRTLKMTAQPAFFANILHQAPQAQVLQSFGTIIDPSLNALDYARIVDYLLIE